MLVAATSANKHMAFDPWMLDEKRRLCVPSRVDPAAADRGFFTAVPHVWETLILAQTFAGVCLC